MKGLYNSLEGFRKKLCIEENQIEAKRKQVNEEIVKKVLKSEARRKDFEARWNEVKARNLKALDEGTFDGPIVPIGLRPPEPPKQKKTKDEVKAEKASFLQLPDEAPEGPPTYVKGGSSGSGGAQGPVEAVPLEPPFAPPPPPEAPVEAVPLVPPPMHPSPEDPVGAGPVEPPLEAGPPNAAADVKKKLAEAPARVEPEAYVALEDQFIAVAKLEDLREEDRKVYEAVKGTGVGVCSRCRWSSGCHSCDEVKAWGFACRSTLWHSADAVVRPKAKPRGRPKKAAAKA